MEISPDAIVYFEWGFIKISATLVYTWVVMAVISLISFAVTRNLTIEGKMSRWQLSLETVVDLIRSEIRSILHHDPSPYLPFVGTLFLFISISNFLGFVPGYHAPTGSINTTAALALCVFFAVPIYGISRQGMLDYFKHYIRPTPLMLPFNVIGEFSRTLALAVRLFGNMMSGKLVIGMLLSLAPLFVPVVMHGLELLIGQIQAFIFGTLATVYIASAVRARTKDNDNSNDDEKGDR